VPPELLQRLRDIHYPTQPHWFPPAPGWWLLLLLVAAGCGWLLRTYLRRRTRIAPYQAALALLDETNLALRAGTLSTREYLDKNNDILKRLLVHVRSEPEAGPASGRSWLKFLDDLNGGSQFSDGPGIALGETRFQRDLPAEFGELHGLLTSFVHRLASPAKQP
jgi:hypothetical protein